MKNDIEAHVIYRDIASKWIGNTDTNPKAVGSALCVALAHVHLAGSSVPIEEFAQECKEQLIKARLTIGKGEAI